MEESMLQTNINAADNKLPWNIKKIDVKYGTISSHDDAFFFFFSCWMGGRLLFKGSPLCPATGASGINNPTFYNTFSSICTHK